MLNKRYLKSSLFIFLLFFIVSFAFTVRAYAQSDLESLRNEILTRDESEFPEQKVIEGEIEGEYEIEYSGEFMMDEMIGDVEYEEEPDPPTKENSVNSQDPNAVWEDGAFFEGETPGTDEEDSKKMNMDKSKDDGENTIQNKDVVSDDVQKNIKNDSSIKILVASALVIITVLILIIYILRKNQGIKEDNYN